MTQFTSWAESSAPPITDGASQYRDYSRTSALAIERETLALRQLENNPNSEGALRNAIQASAVAAQMRSTNRDYAGARQTHLRAIDLCERLLALLPGDHTAQTDLDREIAYVAATFGTPASMASNGRDRARAIAIAIAEEGVLAIRTYMRDSPDHPAWLLALASLLDHVATTQGYERQYPLALAPLEERLQLLQRYAVLRPNDPNIARLIGRATRDLERLRVQLAR